ncbi:hypothetical protein D1164_04430 [Mariniphaga sediminis]|uniref:Ig-like domain-containing protein n=1 Tax=Mariniphaga sediminis TaxID=1628158 RepID=A0A399D428_9BACT|nr:hypothetical protein [Mariniphaga sediminis]RIH66163.1 hypothetical protein D1164_04430 [Mariniphaga sediminis]
MNGKIILTLALLACSFLFLYCSEEEREIPSDFDFYSLVAEKDTMAPGETVKLTAKATGSELRYFWSASVGDILGSGAQVTYAASPCQIGKNQVTCRVTNGSKLSQTKTIDIVVYE